MSFLHFSLCFCLVMVEVLLSLWNFYIKHFLVGVRNIFGLSLDPVLTTIVIQSFFMKGFFSNNIVNKTSGHKLPDLQCLVELYVTFKFESVNCCFYIYTFLKIILDAPRICIKSDYWNSRRYLVTDLSGWLKMRIWPHKRWIVSDRKIVCAECWQTIYFVFHILSQIKRLQFALFSLLVSNNICVCPDPCVFYLLSVVQSGG